MTESPAPPPWPLRPSARRAALAVFAVVLLFEGYQAVFKRQNDVANHFVNGRRLWDAQPGAHPFTYWYVPYPIGRSAINAALASVPYYPFRATCYALGVAGLVGSLVLWERMARGGRPVARGVPFAAGASTVALLIPWVVRDLDDCGLQLMLLFLLTAVWALCRGGRTGWAGVVLGIAVVYKASPLLLVPVLLVTGRVRAVLTATVTVVALSLAPALFIGWDDTVFLNKCFVILTEKSGSLGNPTENGFEPPRHQNQGFMVSVGRLLQTYGPAHPLYLPHPLFKQFFDVPPATADRVGKGVVALSLLYLIGWRIGRRTWAHGGDADTVREAAALTALCALLSPMCWIQHLTLCVPAAYLVFRDGFDRHVRGERLLRRNVVGLVAVGALVVLFAREVVGRELSVVFLSYKVNTLAALTLIGLVLALPAVATPRASETVDDERERGRRLGVRLPTFTRRT